MLKIKVENVRTVKRGVSFKVLGESKKGSCDLTYKVMDIDTASELMKSHDEALPLNQVELINDEGDSNDSVDLPDRAVTMAKWMCDVLPGKYLVKWDVAVDSEEVSEINAENLAALLMDGHRFWAIYGDFIDLITEISGGKAKSVLEQERKNLLRSAASLRNTA